jgi:hypothetical protein
MVGSLHDYSSLNNVLSERREAARAIHSAQRCHLVKGSSLLGCFEADGLYQRIMDT